MPRMDTRTDVRAELYNEAIAAFNEEYPNITVNATFLAFPEFWEKRQTEAAGGRLHVGPLGRDIGVSRVDEIADRSDGELGARRALVPAGQPPACAQRRSRHGGRR